MKMDELKEIVKIIEKAKIDVLKLEKGDFKLYYEKDASREIQINNKENSTEILTEVNHDNESFEQLIEREATNNTKENLHQITSSMIGAFYSRPNPDSDPFVKVGSKINMQDTVCVLEAMKLLNEIKSDINGEIVEILVEDGQIIEFGQPLFTVKVSE